MKRLHLERTLTPAKAGKIFGRFAPSPAQRVLIEEVIESEEGKSVKVRKIVMLNRKERRHGNYNVIRKLP